MGPSGKKQPSWGLGGAAEGELAHLVISQEREITGQGLRTQMLLSWWTDKHNVSVRIIEEYL